MAGEFPSDSQVYQAIDDFLDALTQLADSKYRSDESNIVDLAKGLFVYPEVDVARRDLSDACRPALEIQPGGFHADAEDMRRAILLLDKDEENSRGFYAGYDAALHEISSWQGRAADAFRNQIDVIEKFVGEQARLMTKSAGCLVATYQVSALARTDLISVFHGGADACRAMKETTETQNLQTRLFLDAGLAVGTINLLITSSALAQALTLTAQAISSTTTVASAAIGGSDPQEILDSVHGAQQQVIDRLRGEYGKIAREADGIWQIGRENKPPIAPLPPTTDVHNPGFRYPDFSSPWQSGGAYDDAVHRAAVQPTAAGGGEPSTIRRALG